MPRKPIDYSKTVLYKLVCMDLTITDIYVGQTTDFRARKALHKSACNNSNSKGYGLRVYTFIRGNGGWENWTMIMIHRQNCKDALEARTVERGYVESLGATLNCCVPGRTLQESQAAYCEVHPDRVRKSQAAYKEAHKDSTKIYNKQYREKQKLRLQQQEPLVELTNFFV